MSPVRNIRERHWAVDVGLITSGAFLSAAVQCGFTEHSALYIAVAVIVGAATLYFDRKNVKDEEKWVRYSERRQQ